MIYTINRRGADCKGQLSIPLVKKIDRSSWGTVRRSIFFVIIAFYLGKLCHDLNGQTDHIHDQAQQRENEREQCESLQQIHSISPSLRLQGSGQGTFKKSFLPDLCLFYVEIEKPAIRDRKHDHQFCNQRLIVILTQSFGNYNKSRPAVIPGGGGRCALLRAKQKIFTECRCTHRPAPCSCCARHRTCRTCCRCRCGRPPAGGHRG